MALALKFTLLYGMVLMLVALGGMFSERSGIINIALEGIMVIGALIGVIITRELQGYAGFVQVSVSVLCAGLAGLAYAFLLAFASINLKADQTIGGTALNILATAIAMVIAKRVNSVGGKLSDSARLKYSYDAFVYKIFGVTVNVFLFIGIALLIISYIVLYKTKLGLRLRACGEHPQAANSVGVNVLGMRYTGVLISGFLGGIGGFAYILPSIDTWDFKNGIAGMGFLALAVMIFGQWHPIKIFLAAMFFSIFKSLANIADSVSFLAKLRWPKEIYNMMPFIASIVVLTLTSGKSRAPKAEGIPYEKGQR
ncbi:MAG: ABC transporter permease [Clostridia bacterium]|nr:ABC transporter permease [Clostridia bacterium]